MHAYLFSRSIRSNILVERQECNATSKSRYKSWVLIIKADRRKQNSRVVSISSNSTFAREAALSLRFASATS